MRRQDGQIESEQADKQRGSPPHQGRRHKVLGKGEKIRRNPRDYPTRGQEERKKKKNSLRILIK